ncbi:MAG: glycoside hydrolase family 97 N-terminal domain-containing protein [Asticcacaulis sp.]
MRIQLLTVAAAIAAFFALPAVADDLIAQGDSPDHSLSVKVTVDAGGKVDYEIDRNNAVLIAPSRLGFLLANGKQMDSHFSLESTETASADTTWEQPWGERRYVRDHYNELRVHLIQKAWDNRRMTVVFRLFDDGVGFRYEFPDQPQLKKRQDSGRADRICRRR